MGSEMLERVEDAMIAKFADYGLKAERRSPLMVDVARAAIEEMRRPTVGMVEGPAKKFMDSYSSNLEWWNAMIDAALSEQDR